MTKELYIFSGLGADESVFQRLDFSGFSTIGLRTNIYKVGDLENAKKWYANIFKTEPYFDEPFYVGFNIGGYELGLQPEETPSIDITESVVTYWGVEDIQTVYNEFIEAGAKNTKRIKMSIFKKLFGSFKKETHQKERQVKNNSKLINVMKSLQTTSPSTHKI